MDYLLKTSVVALHKADYASADDVKKAGYST